MHRYERKVLGVFACAAVIVAIALAVKAWQWWTG